LSDYHIVFRKSRVRIRPEGWPLGLRNIMILFNPYRQMVGREQLSTSPFIITLHFDAVNQTSLRLFSDSASTAYVA